MTNNKFSKLGKILALSTAMMAAPISMAKADGLKERPCYPSDPVPASEYSMEYRGEKIHYGKFDNSLEIEPGIISPAQTLIIVEKPDGKIASYMDIWDDDLQIDRIQFFDENGNETVHNKNKNTRMIFKEGQERFNHYMKLIKEDIGKTLD